jgi:hypothetical protein
MTYDDSNPPADQLTTDEVLAWFEFCCWTTLVIAPFLYWFNGPSVSTDQFFIRTALVVFATCGAIGMRVCAWFRRRPAAGSAQTSDPEADS